jgi:hypothetical protein
MQRILLYIQAQYQRVLEGLCREACRDLKLKRRLGQVVFSLLIFKLWLVHVERLSNPNIHLLKEKVDSFSVSSLLCLYE